MVGVAAADKTDESRLRIMAAKIIAQARWPYLSTLIFSLRIIPTKELPTLAVDAGWRMYFNPDFVLEQSPEVLATMVLHEAMHCVSQHSLRFDALGQGGDLHTTWNIAGDANINQVLDEAKMPWGEFDPVRFEGLEKYGVSSEMSTESAFFSMLKYFEANPNEKSEPSDCGSVMGGGVRQYEAPRTDADHPAIKNDQQDVIRDRVAQDILHHARNKGIGSVPGGLLRWARELLEPQVDWRTALAGAFRTSLASIMGRKDYSYMRPSRRQGATIGIKDAFILPSMRKPSPPSVAIVIDTSGSIGIEEITHFLSEVEGIAKSNGISQGITVIPCDAEIGEIQRIRSLSGIAEIKLTGGGGTDMGVGIAAASSLKPIPKIIVVLTDGYTPWPEKVDPNVQSIIVCCSAEETLESVPAYAKTIGVTLESK